MQTSLVKRLTIGIKRYFKPIPKEPKISKQEVNINIEKNEQTTKDSLPVSHQSSAAELTEKCTNESIVKTVISSIKGSIQLKGLRISNLFMQSLRKVEVSRKIC